MDMDPKGVTVSCDREEARKKVENVIEIAPVKSDDAKSGEWNEQSVSSEGRGIGWW